MKSIKLSDILKRYTMVIALILVAVFFAITTQGKILYAQNINNLISQNAYVFVLATGMLLCILTGGNIDLACGSVVCFTGAIGAVIMKDGGNVWLAVIVMLLIGAAVGAWQGFWVAFIKVPPFITTLAGMYAFRGLSNVVLEGYAVGISNATFLNVFGGGADCYIGDCFSSNPDFNVLCFVVGIAIAVILAVVTFITRANAKKNGYTVSPVGGVIARTAILCVVIVWLFFMLAKYKGIPTVLIWIAAVLLIYSYITKFTRMGRYLYAVGSNEKATTLSGIDSRMPYFFAYTNMGFLSGLAGILTVARATQAQPTFGQGYEMDAIASCFIGGASAYGGEGNVFGVVIGAVLMGVINQGMSIMGIEANYQKVVKGLVLLISIIFDVLSNRKKS